MKIKTFYEYLQLSFLDGEAIKKKAESDANYNALVEEVKKKAQDALNELNAGDFMRFGAAMRGVEEYLKQLRRETWGKSEPVGENAKLYNEIDTACNNFAQNRTKPIYHRDHLDKEDCEKLSTKNQFTDILEKLKKARTVLYNSPQYEGIIKMVKFADENDTWKGAENLSAEQKYIAQLLAIKSAINKYINHKAVSGVKQNVYKKLAAVEELNNMITEKLDVLPFETFRYAGQEINRDNYQLSYDEEFEHSNYKKIRGDQIEAPEQISEEYMTNQRREIADRYPGANVAEMMNVDGCMCRILLSAMNHKEVTVDNIYELQSMKDNFLVNPAVKEAPEVRAEAAEGRRI